MPEDEKAECLSPEQCAGFRELLQGLKSDLAKQMEASSDGPGEDGKAHERLKRFDKALAKLDQGTFGYCEECGREIGYERLQARPTAELCLECEHFAERVRTG